MLNKPTKRTSIDPSISKDSEANKSLKGESDKQQSDDEEMDISNIVKRINSLKVLSDYDIRQLVREAKYIGNKLKENNLKTNQVRKFLDAINRIKAEALENDKNQFEIIRVPVIMLMPKLAYAVDRQQAAKPLQQVIDAAIDRVHSMDDFDRLVQFVESIIAYHKAAGGE